MSKIVLIFLSVCLYLNASQWFTYDEAIELQKQSDKIIMLDVVRTHCHYCTDMQREVFDDTDMQAWIEKRFIPVKINLDKDEMPLGIKPVMTPSFYFINTNKEVVKNINGAWDIENFKSITRNIK